MRALSSMLSAFALCTACSVTSQPLETPETVDLSQSPLLQDYLAQFTKRQEIRDNEDLQPIDRLLGMIDVDKETHTKFTSLSPDVTEIGRLTSQSNLANKGIFDIQVLNGQTDAPLYPLIQKMNEATNSYIGLDLPLPVIWIVKDLVKAHGTTGIYQEFGDIIMVDNALPQDAIAFVMANEFGSRATNKLFELEVNSNRAYNATLNLTNVTGPTPELAEVLAIATKNMRECELAETAIASYIMQRVTPEIDFQAMLEDIEQFGISEEDDSYKDQNITFMSHPSKSMALEFMKGLDDQDFFENNRYPTAETSYACNIPFVPSGMK